MATQFDDAMPAIWAGDASPKRLVICGMIALPLFLDATNDLGRRYTFSLNETFVDAGDPKLKGWLPGKKRDFLRGQHEIFFQYIL